VTFWLEPGAYVRHPDRPDWGIGQIQTVVGQRVTVNFENAGKQLINTAVIALAVLDDDLK
jgi:transcription elongation factor GreA-like protein